uniref:uncharacterized protein LOC125908321 n=1 Tax=Anopheles coluzzii TaxID=1518534 RepID=UPI0020FFC45E|nr:uncharacterized protein LOC125908321 [Anopheles coluzzii]
MDKKIKAVQLKKRIALENIKSLERFQAKYSSDDAKQIPEVLEDLAKHKEEFFTAVSNLEELEDKDEAVEASIMERINIEERCRKLKSFLRERQPKEEGSLNDTTGLASSTLAFGRPHAPNLRLPKIELPTFDGDHTKWLSFRDRFIAMIDASAELPSIAKLQYLLSSLKGDAAVPFEHTPLTADNYSVTWAALLKRYDNSRLLIREYYRKLHYLPGVQLLCVDKLTHLVDEFTRFVNGLKKLNEPVDSWDTPLSNMLLMKLDRETLLAWEKHSVHFTTDKYKDVIDFVQDRIQILKSTNNFVKDQAASGIKVAGLIRQPGQRRFIANAATSRSAAAASTAHTQQPKCPLECSEDHTLRNCPVFIAKEVQQRRDVVASKRLCWNCLSSNHQVRACKSDYSCRTCRERHHTLLHHSPPYAPPATVTLSAQSNEDNVFLATANIQIKDDYGNTHEARALLDSGSMSNFIAEEFARKLLTSRKRVNVAVSGIGNAVQQIMGSIVATVQSKTQPFATEMTFLVLDTPSANIPTSPTDVSSWKMPDVALADSTFNSPGQIDIVIGGDTFWELHTGRKCSIGRGKPWLVETHFGWVVTGNTHHSSVGPRLCHLSAYDTPLEETMQQFWESETIAEDPVLSVEENACEKHFAATTVRNSSGRYVVSLPFNSNPNIVLGESKEIADRRLRCIERRLNTNAKMKEEYVKFMKEYEHLGHMKRLTSPANDSVEHYYLPHHAVIKESSTTTKVRVVFDASCKTSSGYSLNDKLFVGSVVQEDLLSIILRFRSRAIALTADVEKMYRQILHSPHDRNYLRIRYREHPADPISTFELQTVTYGTASAPFLATRTLKQIALDHKEEYPLAMNAVMNDFYVDDLLTGTDDLSEAIVIQRQISDMLNSAGFTLKKWASNRSEALKNVPSEDVAVQLSHEWKSSKQVSTLGIVWEPATDTLRFRIEIPPTTPSMTKRLILSYIAKIFDPLGLLGPTIIIAKMFMQQLWALKIHGKAYDWDSELPSHLQHEWSKFHSTLSSLRNLTVPRYISQCTATSLQIHIFADASQLAYGACCYIRAESMEGVTVQLLTAKSKVVALSNSHSIARLELCAARLATLLYEKVQQSLKISATTICWTDSMTVLHWLNSAPNRWKPFVANRVAKIQHTAGIQCWKHVPGSDNPADDISRGLTPEKLLVCERWWHGPHWLARNSEEWPQNTPSPSEDESAEEEKLSSRVASTALICEFRNSLFSRFSIYHKLQRVVAHCLRFIQNAKRRVGNKVHAKDIPPLTVDELKAAELKLCYLSQQDTFSEEIQHLQKGKEIPKNSKLKWISPFIDTQGILRIGGRLSKAHLSESEKHPVILSSKHPLSALLAVSIHLSKLHAAPQLLLTTLRQSFWIIGGRNLCKSVYHSCHACFKAKPTLIKQSIADLPTSRVTPTRPFSVCGVDYCGPIYIKQTIRNRSPIKAYIAIFVCFSTRAVHIELVGDLTSTAFINALRRLIARRGQIGELHSDNATTFKGAAHELNRVYKMLKSDEHDRAAIFDWCAMNHMKWKFIPPRAPHFGGLWEAAVKAAKSHIVRTIGTTSITQESMLTLLAQVEQCLNSRPITPLSDEPSDLEPLTPGHYLVGGNLQAVPIIDYTETPSNYLREYQLVQKHLQTIWARWYPEYLQQLQARAKYCNGKSAVLKENTLVIIKEDNVHPTSWPMGRIVAVHPGKDDVVRVVTLRTASGKQIVRAANRLAVLPNPDVISNLEQKETTGTE